MKIVIDDKIPYLQGIAERYFEEVLYLSGREIAADDVKDADALLIRTRTKCNEQLLSGSRVRYIATATIGHDHIDKEYCRRQGIAWSNAPGCNAFGVVQYVLCFLALTARRGSITLKGKTLGIIGAGEVGSRLAAVAPALGLKVLINDPPRERREGRDAFVDLKSLLERSDIISIHVPLISDGVDRTIGLADDDFFGMLHSSKVFINASRGEVVDEAALKRAIVRGQIGATALDVWNGEPDIDRELMEMADIATPHIAGYSLEGKANGTAASINSILDFFGLRHGQKWYPSNLPELKNKITFDNNLNVEQAIADCLLKTYDIDADSRALKQSPADFEPLRGGYGVRHELSYYQVENVNDRQVAARLKELTFKVECDE